MRFLLINFVLLFAVIYCEAKVIEKVVAIVNSDIVTLTDINDYRQKLRSDGLVDDAMLRVRSKAKLLSSKKALIDHLIDERILDSEVKKQGFTATIEKIEQEIRNNGKRLGLNRSQLIKALKNRGVAFSDYQNFIKTTIERQSLIQRNVTSKIKISDDDISAYYSEQNVKNKTFEYTLSHILFLTATGGPLAAQDRATRVLKKLKSQSFEKLAAKYSEDPDFSQGGLLGSFKSGEMLKEIENGIKKLKPGQHSKLIKTPIGFQIIKLVRKKISDNPQLNQQKNKIKAVLFDKAFLVYFKSWLAKKRQEAFVRIN